jgi:uncharacterized protein DUF6682
MTITLGQMRNDLRAHVDEASATFWSDAQLNTWINDALRDVARRTETLQKLTTLAVVAGTRNYTMPTDLIRCHRMEFDPGTGTIYPLEARQFYELDQIWGTNQQMTRAYPDYYAFYGFPPTLQVYLYPVPSQSGNLNVFYYRLPAVASSDSDVLDIPEGWWDLISLFGEYMALRKDADPRFADAKQIYEEKVGQMIDMTRKWHDQAGMITTGRSWLPSWLTSFPEDY